MIIMIIILIIVRIITLGDSTQASSYSRGADAPRTERGAWLRNPCPATIIRAT